MDVDVNRLQGAEVYSTTGSILGRVVDVLIDEDGSPLWLEVRAGLLDLRGMLLVPVSGVVAQGRVATVLASDAVVAQAPGWHASGTPTVDDLERMAAFWQSHAIYGASLEPRHLPEVVPVVA